MPGKNTTPYDRSQFYTFMQTDPTVKPDYERYAAAVGRMAASYMLGTLFERAIRMSTGDGDWSPGAAPNKGMTVAPAAILYVKTANKQHFANYQSMMLFGDLQKMGQRQAYIDTLRGRAERGELRVELAGKTEPEGNYYAARPAPTPALGAPPIPARTPKMVNMDKAIAWVTNGVRGDTDAYVQGLLKNVKSGQFPLGRDDAMIGKLWSDLTDGDVTIPDWRDMNPATPYPSSIGGRALLKTLLASLGTKADWPAAGDAAWTDWALFLFGAMMTAQPFPDANKRAARTAYALVMLSGEVPFVAPNGVFGGELAQMGG